MPLISVIVPVYNTEKYLHRCIDSILAQTFTDFEVLLINDGSTDSSGEICDDYAAKDSRVRVFHKENGGLSSARNRGIEEAQGEWIIFLDSDDYWMESQVLEHLINAAIKTKADIVRGEYKEVDENGKDLYLPTINKELLSLEGKCLNNDVFAKKILSRGHFSWLFLIRKTEIANMRFNEEQKFQEDIDFNIRFFSVPRNCAYTPLRFYAYRKRNNSIMSTPKVDNLKYSFLLSDTWFHYAGLIYNDRELQQFYRYNSVMMYYWTLETLASDTYYYNKISIIKDLALEERQKKISCWAKNDSLHYPLPVYITPCIGVVLLRLFNKTKDCIFTARRKCKSMFLHLNMKNVFEGS